MVNQAKMARYRHLVFHILEFLQKHQLYPDEQVLKFKIELLNKTNKSLHHTEDAPQGIIMSLKLTLSINPDIWEIKKHLTVSDVRNNQTRLMLPKDDVVAHILDYLTDEERLMIEDANNRGLRIRVYDSDTESLHQLTLKKWHSSGSYVFISN
ncbi:unnamed protein product [Brassica rapa subsp. trilocularis]